MSLVRDVWFPDRLSPRPALTVRGENDKRRAIDDALMRQLPPASVRNDVSLRDLLRVQLRERSANSAGTPMMI